MPRAIAYRPDTMDSDRLKTVVRLIDAANAEDPRTIDVDGETQPAELIYGERMSHALDRFHPDAAEVLQIAARAQHIERWTSPRNSYPDGRVGYLKWRKDLKDFHARRTGELMAEAGYGQAAIDRAGALLRKERLKQDVDVQILEDVVCLVFLEHYATEFIADHPDDKVIDILTKTARKMSADGLQAAAALPLSDRLAKLLAQALES